jgi:hypothetical protein
MMPVANGLTLLEAAILNCLHYGVNSIWITVNDDQLPYAKMCVGEMGYDPVRYWDDFSVLKVEKRTRVPIYFVPVIPKYRDYCDNFTFGFINSALTARKVYGSLTRYCEPDYFLFVSPFGVINYEELRPKRVDFKHFNKKSLITHQGKSALEGNHLPICVDKEDIDTIKRHVIANSNKKHRQIAPFGKGGSDWFEELPKEEQFKGTRLTMKEVLSCLDKDSFDSYELDWFYDVQNWQQYSEFMASGKKIYRSRLLRRDLRTYPLADQEDKVEFHRNKEEKYPWIAKKN